ncbi:MAG: phage major capsid protein, partial [Planctomycetota bacterium]
DLAAFPLAAGGDDPVAALLERRPAPSAVWVSGRLVASPDRVDGGVGGGSAH